MRAEALELGIDEQAHERLEGHGRRPAELAVRTAGVAAQVVQLGLAARQSRPTWPKATETSSSTACVSPLATT